MTLESENVRREVRLRVRSVVVLAIVGLLAAACGNAKSGADKAASDTTTAPKPNDPAQTQVVTPTEIRVGGLVAATGPLGDQFAQISKGVNAYFDMVNSRGGINGRKL